MAISFFNPPEIEEIIARIKTYIKGELEQINPTDQNSLIFSLIVAMANLSNDNNKQILLDILPNIFPQYCKNVESLKNHAELKNISRNPATSAKGQAVIQGNIDSVIDSGITFIANNVIYRNKNTVAIDTSSIKVSKIEVNGTLVTVTTISNHSFASNIKVSISGAENNNLNGDFTVTVTGLNTFVYTINTSTTTTESNGDIIASADIAILDLEATTTGENTNLNNGDSLAISEEIAGVLNKAYVMYAGIAGGADIQSFEDWKANVVERYQSPITYFNENNIIRTAKSVSGVNRVWVYPVTPTVGQVTVYFLKEDNAIPTPTEIKNVTSAITALRTVKDDPADIFVYAPTIKKVDFTFNAISPDTPTMRTAIEKALKELFEDEIELGENLTQQQYNAVIGNAYDMENGAKLKSFELQAPTADIEATSSELISLGSVTFL